jgi:DNA repair photolyase
MKGFEDGSSAFAKDMRRGRGAVTNTSGRFENQDRVVSDDGWSSLEDLAQHNTKTSVTLETPRSIITKNQSPDIPFDRSINPYRGCEHGCIYCFARPTHAFLGLSPGLDFEAKLFAKPDAPQLLEKELRSKNYHPQPIAIGTNTDPYQPIDRQYRLMRQLLDVLRSFNHPVTITTKSALILRDIDILADMATQGLVSVAISVTSLDAKLSRVMEPRASTPMKRLAAVSVLREAGIPVGVLTSPMIPAINDHELEDILSASKNAGALWASYILLRMPFEIKHLFREWLYENFPDRADKVIKLIKDTRGGKDYDAQWGKRMKGEGQYAELLASRFKLAKRKYGLDNKTPPLRTDLFQPPLATGDQLALFG